MGINTAVMFLTIGFAAFLYSLKRHLFSQLFAITAFIISLVTFVGYLLNMSLLYGDMSVFTAACGFLLAGTSLGLIILDGLLKAENPSLTRHKSSLLQILFSYVISILISIIYFQFDPHSSGYILELLTIGTIWFVSLIIAAFSIVFYKPENNKDPFHF